MADGRAPEDETEQASVAVASDEIRRGTLFGPSNDQHEIGEELGAGAAARVFACVRLCTGEQLAVKVINLQRLQLLGDNEKLDHIDKLDREVKILRALRHERVVNLHNVHRTANWYFLVMERIRGGELFHQIVQHKSLNELESRYVFRQLLEGIAYMHSRSVIHRDLKPENILIVSSRPAGTPSAGHLHDVKIADFGLSKVISETTSLAKTLVGTPQYYAPEVLNVQSSGGTYDQAADLWGLGVVLFVMLCGRYPFDGKKAPLEEQIRAASFNMSTKRWGAISEAAKDLVRGLLRVNPQERLRLESCQSHPWVVDDCSPTNMTALPEISSPETPAQIEASVACVDSSCLPTVVEEKSNSFTPHTSGASSCRMLSPNPSGASSSKVYTPLPSGGSSVEELGSAAVDDVADLEDDAKQFWMLSRLWLLAAGKCWRRNRLLKCITTSFFVFFSFALLTGRVFPQKDSGYLEVLPKPPFHIPLTVPTIPLIGPHQQRNPTFTPHQSQNPTMGDVGASSSARCPAHPGDGALIEGCARHPPPHPAKPSGIPSGTPRVPQTPPPQMGQAPPVQLGHNVSEAGEQETIFRLSELLKLQVSIAGSLEMARLAFRHADVELAELTRETSRQARDLFQDAANVVSRYAQVAQQVSQFVLPDLALAVQEREPSLASSLLNMVRDWVTEMKTEGARTQQRYVQLQTSVLNLVRRAQDTKAGADQRLFKAVKAVEAEPSLSPTPGSSHGLTLGPHSSAHCDVIDPALKSGADAVATGSSGGSSGTTATSELGSATQAGRIDMPPSLNSWTQQLFEQLNELTIGGTAAKKSTWDTTGEVPVHGSTDDDMAWRRDLVDLLFMAPGVAPSSLPEVEPLNFVPSDSQDDEVPSYSDGVHVEDDSEDNGGSIKRNEPGNAVVRFSERVKDEAESATHSSTALLRALRELKRVDGILHGCSAFWANMDGTVQRLAQMKEHTGSLINFASKSSRLKERFEQRLGEYVSFWASLERLCRQYCLDHQAASGRMHDFIREMTDAADLIDTAVNAKAGMTLARRDMQLRHRYSMDVYPQSG